MTATYDVPRDIEECVYLTSKDMTHLFAAGFTRKHQSGVTVLSVDLWPATALPGGLFRGVRPAVQQQQKSPKLLANQ